MDVMETHQTGKCMSTARPITARLPSLRYTAFNAWMGAGKSLPDLRRIWNPDEYPIWKNFIEENSLK